MARTTPKDFYKSTLNIADQQSEAQRYSGMAFGFGGTVMSTYYPKPDEDVLKSSIEMIMMTQPGERVMRPEFGAGIRFALFEPNDAVLKTTLRSMIQTAITEWEPRVIVGPVDVAVYEQTVVIRVALAFPTPKGPRTVNYDVELNREDLYNF